MRIHLLSGKVSGFAVSLGVTFGAKNHVPSGVLEMGWIIREVMDLQGVVSAAIHTLEMSVKGLLTELPV
jgi:hypothetical protein